MGPESCWIRSNSNTETQQLTIAAENYTIEQSFNNWIKGLHAKRKDNEQKL
jgi:hypothetical protein